MATIESTTDGPLMVKGITQCRNSRGESLAVKDLFYLCRCGGSNNKPFCDGTHKKIGFKSVREQQGPLAGPSTPSGQPAPAGEPGVQVNKNGPYLVVGVELKCDPAPLDPARYKLCRCGASKNKPYCDGSHRQIGFTDDKN